MQNREKNATVIRYEQGMIIGLLIVIAVFAVFKRFERSGNRPVLPGMTTFYDLEFVPPTSQNAMSRPPTLPKVPVPAEDDYLPEDETIELTMLDLSLDIPLFDGMGGGGDPFGGTGPRPIREVIPEYSKEERNRGAEGLVELLILVNAKGRVDSVRVIQNSTSSRILERAAVEAAYKSAYVPASRDGVKVSRWIRRPYRFERK